MLPPENYSQPNNNNRYYFSVRHWKFKHVHSRALGPYWKENCPNKGFYQPPNYARSMIRSFKEAMKKRKFSLNSFNDYNILISEMIKNYED